MYLALYKGPPSGLLHKIGHYVTAWWTRSPYSHCELVITPINATGVVTCVSSSLRDGGVRLTDIDVLSGHWDLIDLRPYGLSQVDADKARAWAYKHSNAKYDYFGLFFFVIPLRTENRKRWFCSEACAAMLGIPKPWKYTPADLAAYFTEGYRL